MADPKQVHHNGAYDAHPVPPRPTTYRSVGSGRSSSCCGPCCLLKRLIFLAFTVFLFWLVFRPHPIKAYVDAATLSNFNLTNTTNTLSYDLTLDLTIRNPNRHIAFYYDSVEARAIYDGFEFSSDDLPVFYQRHKNTTVLRPAFRGQEVVLGGDVVGTYGREKVQGYFYVEVKVYARIRIKVWYLKIGHVKPKIDCVVKLPVPTFGGRSSGAAGFERTNCDVDI